MTAVPSAAPSVAPVADAPARKTFDAFQRWYINPAKRRRNEWPEDLTESDLEEIAALVPRFLHPDVSGLVLANALGVLLAHLAKERRAHAGCVDAMREASNRQVQRRQVLERTITDLRIDLGAAEAALGRRTMELEDARLCEMYRRRRAEARADDLTASFDLRQRADVRAIERWQAATGRAMEWPDHADLVVWLLERLEAAEGRATELERQAGDRVTVMHAAADELERLWVEHGDGDASPKLVMRLREELGGCYPGRCRAFKVVAEAKHKERLELLERWVVLRCVDAEAERDLLLVRVAGMERAVEALKAPTAAFIKGPVKPNDIEMLTIEEDAGQFQVPMVWSAPAVDVVQAMEAIDPFVRHARRLLVGWAKEPEGFASGAMKVTFSDLRRIIALWDSLKASPAAAGGQHLTLEDLSELANAPDLPLDEALARIVFAALDSPERAVRQAAAVVPMTLDQEKNRWVVALPTDAEPKEKTHG